MWWKCSASASTRAIFAINCKAGEAECAALFYFTLCWLHCGRLGWREHNIAQDTFSREWSRFAGGMISVCEFLARSLGASGSGMWRFSIPRAHQSVERNQSLSTETQCAPPERGHVCLFAIKKAAVTFPRGCSDRYFARLSLMALKMHPESNNGAWNCTRRELPARR